MDECIYCKIINDQIPSFKVYEDEDYLAFLDIRPISEGHTIVVPKKHIPYIEDLSEEEMAGLAVILKKVGNGVMRGLGVKGYSIFLDNKSVANQHVPHVHFHLVPRAEGDGLDRWPQQERYEPGGAEVAQRRISLEVR